MPVRALMMLVLTSGCRQLFGFDDAVAPDVDAAEVDEGGQGCASSFSSLVDTCMLQLGPSVDLSGDATFDTNTGVLFTGGAPVSVTTRTVTVADGEVEAILAESFTMRIDASLRAIGARPFALIVSGDIVLETGAQIDIGGGGSGARTSCQFGATPAGDRDGGAGGGGGAGFRGVGGGGGAGDSDGITPSIPGGGGASQVLPASVLGGCPGTAGGNDNNDAGGVGGNGGGAVLVIAGGTVRIGALAGIDAGGAGGQGGQQHAVFDGDAGGGGGGSGGMIVIEAAAVRLSGTLAANGGGGGEGSGGQAAGNDGASGLFGSGRAAGGSGNAAAGSNGGAGGAGNSLAGDMVTVDATGGGGGGGGGVGFIHIVSPDAQLDGTLSPSGS